MGTIKRCVLLITVGCLGLMSVDGRRPLHTDDPHDRRAATS